MVRYKQDSWVTEYPFTEMKLSIRAIASIGVFVMTCISLQCIRYTYYWKEGGMIPSACSSFNALVLDEYETLHQRILSGESPPKLIVYICKPGTEVSCGGFADRVRGIGAALIWGILTRRALLIHHQEPEPLSSVLMPNRIKWNVSEIAHNYTQTDFNVLAHLNKDFQDHIQTNVSGGFHSLIKFKGQKPFSLKEGIIPTTVFSERRVVFVEGNPKLNKDFIDSVYQSAVNEGFVRRKGIDNRSVLKRILALQDDVLSLSGCTFRYLFRPSPKTLDRLFDHFKDIGGRVVQMIQTDSGIEKNGDVVVPRDRVEELAVESISQISRQWDEYDVGPDVEQVPLLNQFLFNCGIATAEANPDSRHPVPTIQFVIGAHFRAGGNQKTFKDNMVMGTANDLWKFTTSLKHYFNNQTDGFYGWDNSLVIFISDSEELRSNITSYLPNKYVLSPKVFSGEIMHIAHASALSDKLDAFVDVVAEMLLFALADGFALSYSGFSLLASQIYLTPKYAILDPFGKIDRYINGKL